MKSVVTVLALSFALTASAFAGTLDNVHCWEAGNIDAMSTSTTPPDSTAQIGAVVACDDENNCDSPVMSYQLSSTKVKDVSPNGKTIKIVDAATGGDIYSLTVETTHKAPARGNEECSKRNCVEGTLTAKVSIKPSPEMVQRLKDGAHMSCIVGF